MLIKLSLASLNKMCALLNTIPSVSLQMTTQYTNSLRVTVSDTIKGTISSFCRVLGSNSNCFLAKRLRLRLSHFSEGISVVEIQTTPGTNLIKNISSINLDFPNFLTTLISSFKYRNKSESLLVGNELTQLMLEIFFKRLCLGHVFFIQAT